MNGNTPQARAKVLRTILGKIYDPAGEKSNVVDMLTDLRHLCDAQGWDFAKLERAARAHYLPEREGEGAPCE